MCNDGSYIMAVFIKLNEWVNQWMNEWMNDTFLLLLY